MQVAIIGSNENIIERITPLFDDKRIKVKYLAWRQIDLNTLNFIDYLYIDDKLDRKYKEMIFHFCNEKGIKIWMLPSEFYLTCQKKFINKGNLLIYPLSDYQMTKRQKLLKRGFDLLLAISMIIILLPLMGIITIIIRVSDNKPAIYRQKRLTVNKKQFVLYKFRTMVINAEKQSGAVFSSVNDERITAVGRFLRKTRLDELPQLFNVLIGDMSIVGPRPERRYFVDMYEKTNQHYKYRFAVKAGMTGLSQINCRYNADFSDKLNFDLLYISNYRFFHDILIIFKTFKVLFNKKASEGIGLKFKDKIKNCGLVEVQIEPGLIELRKQNEKNRC